MEQQMAVVEEYSIIPPRMKLNLSEELKPVLEQLKVLRDEMNNLSHHLDEQIEAITLAYDEIVKKVNDLNTFVHKHLKD